MYGNLDTKLSLADVQCIEAWLNLPKATSPIKVPAKTDMKYPMLYVMTANMLCDG